MFSVERNSRTSWHTLRYVACCLTTVSVEERGFSPKNIHIAKSLVLITRASDIIFFDCIFSCSSEELARYAIAVFLLRK